MLVSMALLWGAVSPLAGQMKRVEIEIKSAVADIARGEKLKQSLDAYSEDTQKTALTVRDAKEFEKAAANSQIQRNNFSGTTLVVIGIAVAVAVIVVVAMRKKDR